MGTALCSGLHAAHCSESADARQEHLSELVTRLSPGHRSWTDLASIRCWYRQRR